MKGAIIITKTEKAIEACESVLEGFELETMSVSSALLQCLRIARLSNDEEAIQWLQYEYGGYPTESNGYDRKIINKDSEQMFSDLASELEETIKSCNNAIKNFSTSGASVSGEWAMAAMNNLTNSVAKNTGALIQQIKKADRELAILKGVNIMIMHCVNMLN